MNGGFTSTKAIVAAATTVITALIALLIAAGLHIRPELRDAIVGFVTVVTPVVVAVYGLLHHNHAKIVSARLLSGTAQVPHPKEHRR